jgi:transcriptional regulator with XRE-family HTH domain
MDAFTRNMDPGGGCVSSFGANDGGASAGAGDMGADGAGVGDAGADRVGAGADNAGVDGVSADRVGAGADDAGGDDAGADRVSAGADDAGADADRVGADGTGADGALANDAGADDAGGGAIPWYATAAVDRCRNPALRPVPEGEIEELDEDLREWDVTRVREDPRRLRPAVDPRAASSCVAVEVGRALKARRWAVGESQEAYGRRTGRDQARVSRLERGLRDLTVRELVELSLETGRSIRINVFPDEECAGLSGERVADVRLADSGFLRVGVGRAPVEERRTSPVGHRLPWTIS